MNNEFIDENRLREALNILKPTNTLFELRIMIKQPKRTLSGYFRDIDIAVDELKKINLKGCNVFYTLNAIKDECHDRLQHNHLIIPEVTTNDKDITGYDWMLVDLDPVRATGISSTDEELALAKIRAQRVREYLRAQGFEDPIVAMSGNGYHLLYNISLENNKENETLIENMLKALSLLFSDEKVKVDTVNYNPARISKMYGTMAQKGTGTEKRPHRMSYIVQYPKNINPTKKAYLQKIADTLPKQETPQPYNNFSPREFDIVSWMDKHGIRYTEKSGGDYRKFILDECPFDSNHKAPDSMITMGSSGAIGFKCLHNSCSDRTWKDVRLKFEPDAYDQKREEDDARIQAGWNHHMMEKAKKKKAMSEESPPDDTEPDDMEPEKTEAPYFYTAEQILALPHESEERIPTGIEGIDNRMRGGLKKGNVSLVSGLRGGSKSTLLSQIALNAINNGEKVLCYSGELTPRNFLRWMILQAAGKHNTIPDKYANYYLCPMEVQIKIAQWMGERFVLYNNDYGNDFTKLYKKILTKTEQQKTTMLLLDNLMALDIKDLDPYDKNTQQKEFLLCLVNLAHQKNMHIIFVAHPRKSIDFLRLQDVSGTNDLVNLVDNAFLVHRNNLDFQRLTKQMFKWKETDSVYNGTNIIEIAKDRDMGTQDVFIPLWYEKETKRLKNSVAESIHYEWEGEWMDSTEDIPF